MDGWWVRTMSHCFAQSRTGSTIAQSGDWGVRNHNNPGLLWVEVQQKLDGLHWQGVVERAREKGEGGRKAAGVRKQGVSCPYPKYLKVFKYVSRRARRTRCSTQVFFSRCCNTCSHFSESIRIPTIPCTYDCQASIIMMSSCPVTVPTQTGYI